MPPTSRFFRTTYGRSSQRLHAEGGEIETGPTGTAGNDAVGGTQEVNEYDDYDFEKDFQERLDREGGYLGVTAKQGVKKITNDARRTTYKAKMDIDGARRDLLSPGQWDLTVLALGGVVLLAVASLFFGGGGFPDPAQVDRFDSNGNSLSFGTR
eukprot:CAMPEP_0185781580 /NCGR_PEP_ID=MMETSP1174-20130828/102969_1 /TAXON_ID=35687 /ORGANISM="Dictyocha speculum, Strain CCMP1381" /LENGTH=153 /DNA_ID=CAMNT_0028471629 /DNA_START=105 /DNA_END=566 /DNA_ORIENTATION=+